MGYGLLPQTVRRSPFGPSRFNTWLTNLSWLRDGFTRQHLTNGEHSVMEVPRVVRRIDFSGAAYGLVDASTDITAVTTVAVGHCRLTLAAGRFTAADIRPQVNVNGTGASNMPWLPRVEVTSATQVEVYLQAMTGALGEANEWEAADESFDIALHSQPLSQSPWSASPLSSQRFPVSYARGQTLAAPGYYSATASDFNELVWLQADWRKQFLVEHDSDGNHATRQVARHFVQGRYNGVGFDKIQQLSSTTITLAEVSEGRVTCTFSAALTAAISPFIATDWTRQVTSGGSASGDMLITHGVVDSTTVTTLWTYRYDRVANSWNRARGDFWAVWHGG